MKRIFTFAALAVFALTGWSQQLKTGDVFEYNGNKYTVTGENLIENPDFDNGIEGWLGGGGGALNNAGLTNSDGVGGSGAYIRPSQNSGKGDNNSIGMAWPIEKGKSYVFSYFTRASSAVEKEGYIVTSQTNTPRGDETMTIMYAYTTAANEWCQNLIVTEAKYDYLQFCARWLSNAHDFDAFILAEVEQFADPTELLNLIEQCTEWLDAFDDPDEDASDAFEEIISEALELAEDEEPHTAVEFNAMIARLNEALLDFRMACADDDHIVDVTSRYIKNPDFGNGLVDWERNNEAVSGGVNIRVFSYFQEVTDRVCEINGNPAVDTYLTQTVKGLPRGYYIFSVDCVMTHSADLEDEESKTGAAIFCNGAELDMKTKEMTGDGADNANSHPERFEIRGVVTEDSITVGLVGYTGSLFSYVAIDNVKLEYAGFNVGIYLQALVEQVEKFLNDNEAQLLPSIYDSLSDLSMDVAMYIGDEEDVMNEWFDKLNNALKEAKDSFAKMEELGNLNNNLLELVESTGYPGTDAAIAVYQEAQDLIDGAVEGATYQTIIDMIAKVNQAVRDYKLSQEVSRENPADYSFFIVNPECHNTTSGWTGTTASFEYNVAEFYDKDWDMYQKLTGLPNGLYEVGLYGFFRTGANDGGEAYRNGAENLIAKLYAGDLSTSIMSLYTFTEEECGVSGTGTNGYINVRQYADEAFTAGFYSANTLRVIVTDGTLTIGVRGASHESGSWFAFRDFSLKYFGPAIDEDYLDIWNKVAAESDVIIDGLLLGDKAAFNALYDAAKALVAEGKYTEAYTAMLANNETYGAIAATTRSFINGTYASLADADATLGTNGAAVAKAAYGFVKAAVEAADATSDIIAALEAKASAYLDYAQYVDEVDALVAKANQNHFVKAYVDVVKELIAANKEILVAAFYTDDVVADRKARLADAVAAMKKSAALSATDGSDVTDLLIVNPNIDDSTPTGWNVIKGNGNGPTITGEHWTANTDNRYIDSWNGTAGSLNFTAYQVLKDIPNGTYTLSYSGRSDGENAYGFASTAAYTDVINDSTVALAIQSAKTIFLMHPAEGATHGDYWYADSLIWAQGGEQTDIFNANDGSGYGWSPRTIEGIVVEDHVMTIGVTVDSTLTQKPGFTGTWFSTDEFHLTLVKMGDNSNYVIDTNVQSAVADAIVVRRIYVTLDGKSSALPQKGINIVREILSDGTVIVRKELVK